MHQFVYLSLVFILVWRDSCEASNVRMSVVSRGSQGVLLKCMVNDISKTDAIIDRYSDSGHWQGEVFRGKLSKEDSDSLVMFYFIDSADLSGQYQCDARNEKSSLVNVLAELFTDPCCDAQPRGGTKAPYCRVSPITEYMRQQAPNVYRCSDGYKEVVTSPFVMRCLQGDWYIPAKSLSCEIPDNNGTKECSSERPTTGPYSDDDDDDDIYFNEITTKNTRKSKGLPFTGEEQSQAHCKDNDELIEKMNGYLMAAGVIGVIGWLAFLALLIYYWRTKTTPKPANQSDEPKPKATIIRVTEDSGVESSQNEVNNLSESKSNLVDKEMHVAYENQGSRK